MPTAMITGCSRPTGFGQLTAKAFAEAGFHVFATLRNVERAKDLAEWATEHGHALTLLEHDVCNPVSNHDAVRAAVEGTGSLDVLVNNVGMSSFGALETLKNEHIRQTMETNFFSAVDMTRAALPIMRAQGAGRIIFVTSMAGVTGIPGESIYCASKFAIEGMAEALAMEVERFGIGISTIRPAFFNTGMSMHNTDASGFFERGTVYDAFNDRVVASTSEGEFTGEDPAIVARMILHAATTWTPKLRWQPGKSAPEILAGRSAMSDEDWRAYVMTELGMADWLEPVAAAEERV